MNYECVAHMKSLVDSTRRKQIEWLKAVMAIKGWNMSELANASHFDQSTISKFLNDPNNTSQLSTRVISLIEKSSSIKAYNTPSDHARNSFAESEAKPYPLARFENDFADEDGPEDMIDSAIHTIIEDKDGIDPWILQSSALVEAGYLPDDILLVDLNAEPITGDIVCAQIYDRSGNAETVFRIYTKPYLVSASHDPKLRRPTLVDNDLAQIRGVVISSFRRRRLN